MFVFDHQQHVRSVLLISGVFAVRPSGCIELGEGSVAPERAPSARFIGSLPQALPHRAGAGNNMCCVLYPSPIERPGAGGLAAGVLQTPGPMAFAPAAGPKAALGSRGAQ